MRAAVIRSGRTRLGVFVLVAGGLAALLVGASGAAAAAPTTKFVSKRYGYSIVLPGSSSHWSPTFASIGWSSGEIPGAGDPALDTYTDLRRGGYFLIAARQVPAGETLEKWTAVVLSARPPVCTGPRPKRLKSTLDRTPALVVTWSCTDGYWVIAITALHSGRGYFMLLASQTNLSRASDQRAFDAARRSFRFLRG
jgi:hypothetical protein